MRVQVLLYLDTGNDTAGEIEARLSEVPGLLKSVAADVAAGSVGGKVRDVNGNTVGDFDVSL